MSKRLFYIALVLLLAAAAALFVGWTANRLVTAENDNLQQWQQRMIDTSRTRGEQLRVWLSTQQDMAQELAQDERIIDGLRQIAAHTAPEPLATPQIDRAAFEFGTLKYGINHVYVFNNNSEQVGKSEKSRSLPISLREHLARAYATSLDDYIIPLTVDSTNWLLVSRRVRNGSNSLGYVAYLQEAAVAAATLEEKPANSRPMNFLLARRVGDIDVYLMAIDERNPRLFRYPLSEMPLPVFKGATPMFGLHGGLTGQPTMVHIDSVPGYPFWQLANLVSADALRESVAQERFLYLLGAALAIIGLLFVFFSLSRRIVKPEASLIPFHNSLRKAWETHTVGGNAPKYLTFAGGGSPTDRWHSNTPQITPESSKPAGLKGLFKSTPFGRFLGLTRRKVSDAEIAATTSPKNAPRPTTDIMPQKKEAPKQALRAEVLPDEPKIEAPQPEAKPAETPAEKIERITQPKPKPEEPTEDEAARIEEIMRCLREERLRLFFQPIVDITNNQRVMFETFLRLVKENGDLMLPGEFIPLAIKHNFIAEIDDAVIAASLRRHMEVLTQGKATTLSINLSYGAFASHQFMETFELGLASGRIKPQYLNFEVASRELIEDPKGMAFIRDMRENGCKFSVDFFGDLRVVEAAKRMGFNYMKVDCLKFRGLEEGDSEQVAAFRNLVIEAQKHNLPLIAEKVENKTVWWLCKRLGVPMVQGYYIAEPSPRLELGW